MARGAARTAPQDADRRDGAAATPSSEVFRIFISYTHADERFREELDKHLSPYLLSGRLESWHDRHIRAGASLYQEIQGNIDGAHIILMLISADYLHSKACQDEMSIALKRSDEGAAVAIPIIIRPCHWQILPIGTLMAANEDGKPIKQQPDADEAWTQVAKKIGELLNDWQIQRAARTENQQEAPINAAAEDEQSLRAAAPGKPAERWVNRREDHEIAWREAKGELIDALTRTASADSATTVALNNVRSWGEKIIIDFTLPQHQNPRRVIIQDIGGLAGYPGYQLQAVATDQRIDIGYSRVRWLVTADGTRVLRQTPTGADFAVADYADDIWRRITALARP